MPALSLHSWRILHQSILILCILLGICIYTASPVHAAWYSSSWQHRKTITIDNTKVPGSSNLTSFPVLINIASDGNLSSYAQADGDDILFTSSDETTKIDHEIEYYNSGTGQLIAWVEVPTVSYNVDTVIYMYYGNNSASNQQTTTATWNSNYKAVYHLTESGNGSSGEFNDSTTNNNDATGGNGVSANTPTQTSTAKIYKAQSFDGTNDTINRNSFSNSLSNIGTVSFWVRHESASTSYLNMLTTYASGGADDYHIEFYKSSGSNTLRFEYVEPAGNFISGSSMSQGTWYYLTGTWDGSAIKFYVDGSYVNQDTSFTQITDALNTVVIGAFYNIYSGPTDHWPGIIDEVHFNSTALTADWITTEYNNQNDPSTFYSLGSQEDAPASTFTQAAFRFYANIDSTDVGAAVSSQDTIYEPNTPLQTRLRILLHIGTTDLTTGAQGFKLQYAEASGTCDTSFTGESYADVTTSTPIAYYNNATPANASNLTNNASDPTHSGHTIVNQTYVESNYFSNATATIPAGQDGKWDFSLDNTRAYGDVTYCLRVVKDTGVALDTYSVIPQIRTPPSIGFRITAVDSGTTHNGITTSTTSTATALPFNNLHVNTPKYVAHELYATTNSQIGYTVTMNLLSTATIQGLDPANNFDPFAATGASWSNPIPWTSPTGTTRNIDTGWIGANTSDTRVTGWSSAANKFGPVSTTPNIVMTATGTDTGSTIYVTYAMEANVLQPSDMYSGQIVYTMIPTY